MGTSSSPHPLGAERGASCAMEGEVLELNSKNFLGKFAALQFLKTFENGSDSSIVSDRSRAEAAWEPGREPVTS